MCLVKGVPRHAKVWRLREGEEFRGEEGWRRVRGAEGEGELRVEGSLREGQLPQHKDLTTGRRAALAPHHRRLTALPMFLYR